MAKYLRGSVLNAGCGNRDISGFLAAQGAHVTNCDVATEIAGAVICNLSEIPFRDECFDAVLNNAVMEHVVEPDRVMREFGRVLRDGGM